MAGRAARSAAGDPHPPNPLRRAASTVPACAWPAELDRPAVARHRRPRQRRLRHLVAGRKRAGAVRRADRASPTTPVSITVLLVTPMRSGKLFALAAAEIDFDGVPLEIHGIRALHVPPAATRIGLPTVREAAGKSQAKDEANKPKDFDPRDYTPEQLERHRGGPAADAEPADEVGARGHRASFARGQQISLLVEITVGAGPLSAHGLPKCRSEGPAAGGRPATGYRQSRSKGSGMAKEISREALPMG